VNKIIIVGHHSSGIQDVESLLQACGMKPAVPSRREGLRPNEITAAICNASLAPSLGHPATESNIRQIEPAAMWNALALDLAIANSEQGLWGWADSQAIYLLEYWLEIDPQAAFVLVYDEPKRMLMEADLRQAGGLDESLIQKLLNDWTTFNSEMLSFFLRHPNRCALVNSRQVGFMQTDCIQHFQERLNLSLNPTAAYSPVHSDTRRVGAWEMMMTKEIEISKEALMILYAAAADQYDTRSLLAKEPDHQQLYDELQTAADLPLAVFSADSTQNELEWGDLIAQPQLLARNFRMIHGQFLSLREQQRQSTDDHELIVHQLRQAQEELEHYFLENRRLKKEVSKLPIHRKADRIAIERAASERVKQQLSYRLGATMVIGSRSLGGCLSIPFLLLGEARRFRKLKSKRPGKRPGKKKPANKSAEAVARVKQQLSYRIGNTLIKNSRSPVGWIKLPFALIHEIIDFNKKRRPSSR
jgi:hypothetical protein